MPTLDVFKADAFSLASLTEAILKVPHQPGRIGQLGLFRERGITTTTVQVEEKDGQLSLIATSPRGGVPDALGAAKRKVRSFVVPHLAREARIQADEVQNVRAFGTENEVQTVQSLVNERLMELRAMHEVTLEHHRIGALKGQILDADGTTSLFNLFTEFGVSQQTQDFNFGTDDVRSICVAAQRLSEDELKGTVATAYRGLCSAQWFDALVGDTTVKEAFRYQQGQVLGQDLRAVGFTFGGVIWEEYRGKVTKADGSGTVSFIGDNLAYLVPVTAPSIFVTHFAPADFMETVNTLGLPLYAKIAPDEKFNRYADLHTQSNPLALCTRPRAVIKLTMS
jgi:hypothetical protein